MPKAPCTAGIAQVFRLAWGACSLTVPPFLLLLAYVEYRRFQTSASMAKLTVLPSIGTPALGAVELFVPLFLDWRENHAEQLEQADASGALPAQQQGQIGRFHRRAAA